MIKLINKNFVKYSLICFSSYLIELLIFALLNPILISYIGDLSSLISTIIGRFLSSLYNYYLLSRYIFKSKGKKVFVKFFTLVAINGLTSSLLIYLVGKLDIGTYTILIKIIIDTLISLFNYLIQKTMIF